MHSSMTLYDGDETKYSIVDEYILISFNTSEHNIKVHCTKQFTQQLLSCSINEITYLCFKRTLYWKLKNLQWFIFTSYVGGVSQQT